MRIKKTSQYMEGGANLSNVYGTSNENGYTQKYINGIIESGSNENGNWIKFADGTMICYGKKIFSTTISSSWGNWYRTGTPTAITYPQEFITEPSFTINLSGFYSALAIVWASSSDLTKYSDDYTLIRPSSEGTTHDYVINWTAIGKWK